jgi:hypothetical protein
MTMQLKFQAAKLIEALDFVKIVDPRGLTAQQNSAAFLFNCGTDKEGKPVCHIYSRGKEQVARATFPLTELDGEGLFTMPNNHIEMVRLIPDDEVTITSRTEMKPDGEAYVVSLASSSGSKYQHTTFDPRLIAPCDRDFEAAAKSPSVSYDVGLLHYALSMGENFLPGPDKKDSVGEQFHTIQIFDDSNPDWAKGDGSVFCSDASRAFFFECADLKGKGFSIHGDHVGKLQAFLSKCEGVKIYRGDMFFAVNTDKEGNEKPQIFGWNPRVKTHTRYAYYSPGRDKYVLAIPKASLLNALKQAEILIDQKQERVKIIYKHAARTIQFGSSESAGTVESFPVTTHDKDGDPTTQEEDFECSVSLKSFRSIISDAVGHHIELRISPIPKDDSRPRGGAMIRTIDDVKLDANGKVVVLSEKGEASGTPKFQCKVTRFMPSMT